MRAAAALREAAAHEAPPIGGGVRRIATWIGMTLQFEVMPWLDPGRYFYQADEDTQRNFMLLVAEALS